MPLSHKKNNMEFIKTKGKFIIGIFVIFIILGGCGCKEKPQSYKMNLEVWGAYDDSGDLEPLFNAYRETNPNIGSITYRKFTPETYREELIDAMAAGKGPDIFMVHNTWIPSFENKIAAAPSEVIGEQLFRESLVDVTAFDFMKNNQVYATPLTVDSLALYYNKDLFNAAGIVSPPQTWQEVNDVVEKLAKIDENGEITQQGIALGTAKNINRSVDILGLLMMQEGSAMATEDGRARIDQSVNVDGELKVPGENAMRYYTQFARTSSPLYTWNKRQHYSIDAFIEGTAAMMLNYSWQYKTIQSKNEKLNFAVAEVPQLSQEAPLSYANYWGFAVAARNDANTGAVAGDPGFVVTNDMRINEAWQFLRFASLPIPQDGIVLKNARSGMTYRFAVEGDPTTLYLEKTGKPAARRDLLETQFTDVILGPFAKGNLIAHSWVQVSVEANEAILAEAIDSVNMGAATVTEAVELAASRISKLAR